LASRAHQKNIIPVVDVALQKAGINKKDIDAIAFTRGPGLLGSLLVGTSFAKGFSIAASIPMIEVNHLKAHILAHFIKKPNEEKPLPGFPFLCLLVSGGHTQLVIVHDYLKMEIIGQTIDDAAGEAFDKCAKLMDLPYPGGPVVDQLAKKGNPGKFTFAKPQIPAFNYSFSGLKTSFLYFLRDQLQTNKQFIEQEKENLCASLQHTIINILMEKLDAAVNKYQVKTISLAGGVSANSGLRQNIISYGQQNNCAVFIPPFEYTTDNAAMIAVTGYYKYLNKEFAEQGIEPLARYPFD
jgi:N6-L-threonylcarbamoyladenine synthase